MLNLVSVEGYLTRRRWRRDGHHFFRLACYRDPDRPRKHQDEGPGRWDRPDYISIKVPPELVVAVVSLQPGQRVRVTGWVESEEYRESLRQFLRRAGVGVPEDLDPDNITVSRVSTWVVADRIVPVPLPAEERAPEEALADRDAVP